VRLLNGWVLSIALTSAVKLLGWMDSMYHHDSWPVLWSYWVGWIRWITMTYYD